MTGSLKIDKQDPNILIILMGSLGDVTRGLSLAHQIKSHFPKSRLTWLVEPACKSIVSLNQYIDRVIVYDRPKGIFAIPALYREMRKEQYDLVFDLQRHFKSGLFSWLSGSKTRIGFYPANSKEFNYLFNNYYIQDIPKGRPKMDHYHAFIEKLGKEVIRPLDFGLKKVKDAGEPKKKLEVIPRPYIGLVMGSRWESKDWPLEYYVELARKIIDGSRLNIVLIGDATQEASARHVEGQLSNSKRLINLAGKTSLADIVAIIDESELCVGPDSGPGHISGALDKRYISLFGPTDPALTAPFGSEHLVIKANLGCMPCYKRRCPGLGKLCMYLITPSKVYQTLLTLRGT